MLVSPRIYYAMAQDGDFFSSLAWLHPRSKAPVIAITLQGVVAIAITLLGTAFQALREGYQSILDGVTAIDFTFFALAALAVFVFRRRDRTDPRRIDVEVPGHPYTTAIFGIVSAAVVVYSAVAFPKDTLPCIAVLLSGVPAYALWRRYGAVRRSRA
jgi:basic amino acid/polyamine antiporter, APA family